MKVSPGASGGVAVDVDHRDSGRLGGLDRHARRRGTGRDVDERVDSCG